MTESGRSPITVASDEAAETEEALVPKPIGVASDYQPALDGVRAVAVIMVIGFHLGITRLSRGAIGVDVFFVLSGYLITALLLKERQRTGRISFKNFYIRRFLRLAPLSIGLVLLCLGLVWLGLTHQNGIKLPKSTALSILLYYANWWNMAHPSYMGSFGHTWSLSIEEQFYLVWPSIMVASFWLFRRHAKAALITIAISCAVGMGIIRQLLFVSAANRVPALALTDISFQRIYQSSFLRPDGLLFGCLLALLLHRVKVTKNLRAWVTALGLVGIVAGILIMAKATSSESALGVNLLPPWALSLFNVATTCAIAWLVLVPRSPFGRLLSLAPMRWIGRRAYGIYLLHPILLAVIRARTDLSGFRLDAALVAATLIVAGASFRWFESPFLQLKERFAAR